MGTESNGQSDSIPRDALLLVKAHLSGDGALMKSVLTPYVTDLQRTGELMERLVMNNATYLARSVAVDLLLETLPELREPYETLQTAVEGNPARVLEHLESTLASSKDV
jgi:hypothetical protein